MSSRRLSIGLGDSFRSLSLAGVALAALLFLGACTSNGAGDSTTTLSIPQSTSSSTDPPSTSTSTSTSTAVSTTLPPTQDVIDAWSAYWDAWAEVRASDDLDPAPLNALASVDVVEGALTLFERQRTSGLGAVQTEVSLHATVTDSDPDKASIEDCVLLSPSFTNAVGVWYQADLSRTDQGWVVAAVRIPSGGGCVPEEMAEAAITGYEAYYEAQAEFWDPPDPDNSLLDQVLLEPQKSFIVDLVKEHQAQGVALRGSPATHPEVIEVRSPTELVILDCFEPAPDFGLYDVDTGERIPGDVPVREGQRNLRSAVMVLDEGRWKVSDFQGQVDFACEFAPTERGLPSV